MTYLGVHWKGRPHHQPRIQAALSCSSTRSQILSQAAAVQVVRRPFGPHLKKARRNQICPEFSRTRRSRPRRSSTPIVSIRKRTSRAKQNLQVFGWDSSTAEVAGFLPSRRLHSTVHLPTQFRPKPVRQIHLAIPNNLHIPSIDGACHSTGRTRRDSRPTKGNLPKPASIVSTPRHPQIFIQSPTASPLSTQKHSVYRGSQGAGRHRTYDPRISPVWDSKRVQYLDLKHCRPTGLRRPSTRKPSANKIPNYMITAPNDQEVLKQIRTNSTVNSRISVSVSRSPSERRALRKFTKELERHLQETKDLPKRVSLATLPSITTAVSAHTIVDLEPYKLEFRAAGLAVTSDEQRGMAFGRSSKLKRVATLPPVSKRPERSQYGFEKVKSSKKPARQPSYASRSTGTTVMGFTPPHEKSYDAPGATIPRRRSSSDRTVLGFTPPHEMVDRIAKSMSKQTTKKSLPWLRKQESPPPGFSLTKKTTVHEDDVIRDMMTARERRRRSSLLNAEAEVTTKKSQGPMTNQSRSPVLRQDIFQQTKYDETTREPNTKALERVATKQSSNRNRNKSTTPTLKAPAKPSSSKKYSSSRTPRSGGSRKRCPLNESQCAGDCQPDDPESPRLETQTQCSSLVRSQRKTTSSSDRKDSNNLGRPKQPSNVTKEPWPKDDREMSCPIEFGFGSLADPVLTLAGSEYHDTVGDENDEDGISVSSDRETNRKIPTPENRGVDPIQEGIQLQPNRQRQSSDQDTPDHICNSRPSVVCQQCFPSRRSSTAISPFQSTAPAKDRAKRSPGENVTPNYPPEPPMPDPIKKPTLPKLIISTLASQPKAKKTRVASAVSRTKLSNRVLNATTNSAKKATSSTSLDTYLPQTSQVSDKSVFRGLHVATAAACDEDIDMWIEELTGLGVRKFLAELSKFDGLGVNALANVARRAAKQRREEIKGWELLRAERMKEKGMRNVGDEDHGIE